jgi:hypothetical protein
MSNKSILKQHVRTAGGMQILRDGVLVAACDIGGATDERDDDCTRGGIAALQSGIVERLSTSTGPYRRDDRQATTCRHAYGADDSSTAPRSA